MTRIEISFNGYQKELEKLMARLEKAEKTYEKKIETAKKYGVDQWTAEDRYEWSKTVETTASGFFANKADGKKNGAWFDMVCAESRISEIKHSIERVVKNLDKVEQEMNAETSKQEEITRIDALANKYETNSFEQFKAECAKDGIDVEYASGSALWGTTTNGKKFYMEINNGFTKRSWYSYTLTIDGNTVFTSGLFQTAYRYLMAH